MPYALLLAVLLTELTDAPEIFLTLIPPLPTELEGEMGEGEGVNRPAVRALAVDAADDLRLLGACGVDSPELAVLYVPVLSAVLTVDCRADAPEVVDTADTGLETEAEEVVVVVVVLAVEDRAVDTRESVLALDVLVLDLETGLEEVVREVATDLAA